MSELTREQVAETVHEIYLDTARLTGWPIRAENDKPYSQLHPHSQALDLAFADWHLAQIAALRRRLEELERECRWAMEMLCAERVSQWADTYGTHVDDPQVIQQLEGDTCYQRATAWLSAHQK